MGILDSLGSVIGGKGKTTEPVALEEGETEIARVVACTVKGGGHPWVGGDLVLTDLELTFTPLNVQDAADLLTYGLEKVGAPDQAWLLSAGSRSRSRPSRLRLTQLSGYRRADRLGGCTLRR